MAANSAGAFDATGTSFEAAQPVFDYLAERELAQNDYNSAEAAAQRRWQSDLYSQEMAFNAAEAAKNRDWQEMMSNTAHQREVRDLIAAGLNPVLSASGGNGASTGSGAQAMLSGSPSGARSTASNSISQLVSLIGGLIDQQTKLLQLQNSASTVQGTSQAIQLAQMKREWEIEDREYEEDWYERRSEIDKNNDIEVANAKPGTGVIGGTIQGAKNLVATLLGDSDLYLPGNMVSNTANFIGNVVDTVKGWFSKSSKSSSSVSSKVGGRSSSTDVNQSKEARSRGLSKSSSNSSTKSNTSKSRRSLGL